MAPRIPLALLALFGCQPGGPYTGGQACQPGPTPSGELRLRQVTCSDEIPAGGEGRVADTLVANNRFRAIVRHPGSALSVRGGGGTVVDGAPWGADDALIEAVPIVGGGWLDVDTFELDGDTIHVGGTVVDLWDRPAEDAGEWREIRWRALPDRAHLLLEGADGLWLHARGTHLPVAGQLPGHAVSYGHDGILVEDLGGALRIDDVERLVMSSPDRLWAELGVPGQSVSGTASAADRVDLLRDGETIGWLPVDSDGSFEGFVPSDIDFLAARGTGGRSELTEPGESLALTVPTATVELSLRGPDAAWVTWTSPSGAAGSFLLEDGSTQALPPGRIALHLEAGPSWEPANVLLTLSPGATHARTVRLQEAFDPARWVPTELGLPADRAWNQRVEPGWLDAHGVGTGQRFGVSIAANDVPDERVDGRLPIRIGSEMQHPDGWRIVSWPWDPKARLQLRGAFLPDHLSPVEALSAARGGPSSQRLTLVDLAWLDALEPAPWTLQERPFAIRLPHPTSEPETAWAPWLDWLDSGLPARPVGPITWVEVEELESLAGIDVEAGMWDERMCASTGPLLTLRSMSGSSVDDAEAIPVDVRLHTSRRHDIETIQLWVDGVPVDAWDVDEASRWTRWVPRPERWAIAIAQGSADWATTAPLRPRTTP